MTARDFLLSAKELGFSGVQLCENLRYSQLSDTELRELKRLAGELGLFIEVGFSGITQAGLARHLDIAAVLGARFVRIVLGSGGVLPERHANELRTRAVSVIRAALPRCRDADIVIGIENHFDLSTDMLVSIAEELADERVGLIFDTTNALGFTEKPQETLVKLRPYLCSIHLKDYIVKKVEAGYFVTGTVLGEGLLDLGGILSQAVQSKPDLSVILELTIRREDNMAAEMVLELERENIRRSVGNLGKIINL
jgi:sugar phosphate isomerase/epimerase